MTKHLTITIALSDEEVATFNPPTDFHIANFYKFELERKHFKNIISVTCRDV